MGSLFMGDFAEASSDVDFLVVTVHTPTQEGVEQLARLHTRLSDMSPWGARLEGAYAAESALRPWGIDGTVVAIEPGGPLCEGPSEYSADKLFSACLTRSRSARTLILSCVPGRQALAVAGRPGRR